MEVALTFTPPMKFTRSVSHGEVTTTFRAAASAE
jgi:hypothetical protein